MSGWRGRRSSSPGDQTGTIRGEVPLGLSPGLGPPPPTAAVGRRSVWRRHRAAVGTVGGLIAAAAGVVLSVAVPDVPVFADAAGYHVGDAVLGSTGAGRYGGGAIVVRTSGATVAAGSSLTLDGHHVDGSCRMIGDSERCAIAVDGSIVTCDDHVDRSTSPPAWQRRCDDGSTARIPIPAGGPVPVPVPVDR